MELLLFVRNGVLNIDFAVKQMKKLLPEELREPYTHAANACRTAGILTSEMKILFEN